MEKKKGLRIQSGALKGREIKIPSAVHGHSNFSPAILKKSLFSILDSMELQGKLIKSKTAFLDLFAGSGQMGMEALSRGFHSAYFWELESDRFWKLRESIDQLELQAFAFRKDSLRVEFPPELQSMDLVLFLDPPYPFWEKREKKIRERVVSLLEEYPGILAVFIQAPHRLEWEGFENRPFGKNILSVWKR